MPQTECVVTSLTGTRRFQVNVMVDYIRAATTATETGTVPAFPERTCATVTIGGM